MKKQIATKTISKIIIAGLIVSMLPMNLNAKTLKKISGPLGSWETQRPSKEAIDNIIKKVKRLKTRLLKILLTSLGAVLFSVAIPLLAFKKFDDPIKLLKKLEERYPGILTKEQIETLEKLALSPITKKIIKKMRLAAALENSINLARQKKPDLKKTTIMNYLERSKKARNLQLKVNARKEKIKQQKKARNKHSKLSRAYHARNVKLIALKIDPAYTTSRRHLKWFKDKLKKTRKKYPGIEQKLAPIVSSYIQKVDKIITELSK